MFRWALCPFNQVQLKIETAAHFKVQCSLALFELDDSFAVSRLHLTLKRLGGGGVNLTPPCGFLRTASSKEWVKPWLFMTYHKAHLS